MKEESSQMEQVSNLVRSSASFVVEHSNYVEISEPAIEEYVNNTIPSNKHWLERLGVLFNGLCNEALIELVLVFNTISFCYWGKDKWRKNINDKIRDGSELLLMCLIEARKKDKDILKPESLKRMSEIELKAILKGGENLQFIKERHSMLNDLGRVVSEKFSNDYFKIIEKSNGNAQSILSEILLNFQGFSDYSIYEGRRVPYFKRAQLLVHDFSYCIQKIDGSPLLDVDSLTACADYKLPQMLRMHGILIYENSLATKIDNLIEIEKDSVEENEIRASTIVAVEMIVEAYKRKGMSVNSIEINDDLWVLSQSMSKQTFPYHRTKTICY